VKELAFRAVPPLKEKLALLLAVLPTVTAPAVRVPLMVIVEAVAVLAKVAVLPVPSPHVLPPPVQLAVLVSHVPLVVFQLYAAARALPADIASASETAPKQTAALKAARERLKLKPVAAGWRDRDNGWDEVFMDLVLLALRLLLLRSLLRC
jgi:hypothetical protein